MVSSYNPSLVFVVECQADIFGPGFWILSGSFSLLFFPSLSLSFFHSSLELWRSFQFNERENPLFIFFVRRRFYGGLLNSRISIQDAKPFFPAEEKEMCPWPKPGSFFQLPIKDFHTEKEKSPPHSWGYRPPKISAFSPPPLFPPVLWSGLNNRL